MGVLDVLSGLAMAGGQAAAGEAIDQQTAVKNALEQARLKEEQDRNAVLNAIGRASIDPTVQRALAGARSGGEIEGQTPGLADRARIMGPIERANKVADVVALAQPTADAEATKIKTVAPVQTAAKVADIQATAPVQTQADVARTTALAGPEAQAAGQKAGAVQAATLPGQIKLMDARLGGSPLAQRAGVTLPQLDTSLANLQKYTDVGLAGKVFGNSKLGPFLESPEGQNAAQAYREFATAYLMAKYGKIPAPNSINEIYNQIVPQGTETSNPTALKQKAQRVQQMRDEIAGLARQPASAGGPAIGGFTFDDLPGRSATEPIPPE